MKFDIKLAVVSVLAFGYANVTSAEIFEDARAAFDRGDYATALRLWRPLAEQGNARAEVSLGEMYARGRGVNQDHAEAVKWFRQAADQGNPAGEADLGLMFYRGYGEQQDYIEAEKLWPSPASKYLKTKAVKWFRLAAEQGNARGQASLGFMYETGDGGLPKDFSEAVRWYRLSAEQGVAVAQNNLGNMYRNGNGVPRDFSEAARWYRLSAEQGFARAQFNLGMMYRNGYGVPKDDAEALQWFRLAAKNGDRNSIDLIKRERETRSNNIIKIIFLSITFLTFIIIIYVISRIWSAFFLILRSYTRYLIELLAQGITLIKRGTPLQKCLMRFWIAVSVGWLAHSFWWIFSHCQLAYAGGYECTSGTFRIAHAYLSGAETLGYVLATPLAMMFITFAAYWVIRGFQSR